MQKIADHIVSAEPVRMGSDLYKALRNDGRILAVQVFPITIAADKYDFFKQQVELLDDARNHYHANVPAILGWGFTQAENYPFIEREWIDGYSVAELPNREKMVSVDEIGMIAEQASRVLALCHNVGVVHGNIDAEQIIWDKRKEQYSLTGFVFGLNTLEQAPAKTKIVIDVNRQGADLFSKEKDINELGLLLKELVREHLLPRNRMTSAQLGNDVFNETLIDGNAMPAWLTTCISRAVSTGADRFKSAHEMYSYILLHHKTLLPANRWYRSKPQQASRLRVKTVNKRVRPAQQQLQSVVSSGMKAGRQKMRFVFDRRIAIGLVIAGVLAGFSIIAQKGEQKKDGFLRADATTNNLLPDTASVEERPKQYNSAIVLKEKKTGRPKKADKKKTVAQKVPADSLTAEEKVSVSELGAYKVRSKAYFHTTPDEATRRRAFIVHWNNAVLHPLQEENDFVYVVYTNREGQTTKGWLRKKDLERQ